MKRWLKADLHLHTRDDPLDGGWQVRHSSRELIDLAAERGYRVLEVTNHNQLYWDPGCCALQSPGLGALSAWLAGGAEPRNIRFDLIRATGLP